ncbi:unnamed protein product [Prunus brigantina]
MCKLLILFFSQQILLQCFGELIFARSLEDGWAFPRTLGKNRVEALLYFHLCNSSCASHVYSYYIVTIYVHKLTMSNSHVYRQFSPT